MPQTSHFDRSPDASDLRDLMTRTMSDLDGPVDRLHATSVSRGRRLRRRRQTLAAVGSAAAVAAAVALSVTLAGGGPVSADHNGFTGHSSDGVRSPSGELTGREPGSDAVPNGFWDMPAKRMLERLRPLLPDGIQITSAELTSPDRASGEPLDATGVLIVDLKDGADRGALEIMLWQPSPASAVDRPPSASVPGPRLGSLGSSSATMGVADVPDTNVITCPGNLLDIVACQESRDDQGLPLERRATTQQGAILVHAVTRISFGNGYVYGATSNTVDDKWGPASTATATQPLLTLVELRSIVDSSTWTDWP